MRTRAALGIVAAAAALGLVTACSKTGPAAPAQSNPRSDAARRRGAGCRRFAEDGSLFGRFRPGSRPRVPQGRD